jgi:predicted mannosyl-3-phosphoglycerate phosphatase (HAD superfamily)
MQIANKQRVGRPAREYTVQEIGERVGRLRAELAALTKAYVDGTATMPNTTEKEILRVSRALSRENAMLQSLLADEQTERMF